MGLGNILMREGLVIKTEEGETLTPVSHRDIKLVATTAGFLIVFATPVFLAGVAIQKLDTVENATVKSTERIVLLEQKFTQVERLQISLEETRAEVNRLRNYIDDDKRRQLESRGRP